MMAGSNDNATEMLIQAIDSLQATRYTSAAATTIYLYNIFLTLDLELEYIWKRFSFNLPMLLYITNRYICLGFFLIAMWGISGFHNGFTDDYCKTPVDYIGFTLAHAGWTGIMTLIVSTLWARNRVLIRFIVGLLTCVMATVITIGYLGYREIRKTLAYNPYIRICAPDAVPGILRAYSVAPATYELFLTALTIAKAFSFAVPLSSSTFPLIFRVLARDALLYFVVSTTISVINVIVWYCLPSSQYLLLSIYFAMMSTLMARMMLNLRATHDRILRQQLETEGATVEGFGS